MAPKFEFIKDKVLLLTPNWNEAEKPEHSAGQVCRVREQDGIRTCEVLLPVDGGELAGKRAWLGIRFEVLGKGFDLIKIGPGTWKVDGMAQAREGVNAYVILCGVPEPAPWEGEQCHTDSTLTNSSLLSSGEKPELSKAV